MSRKNALSIFAALLAAAVFSTPAHALTCGQQLTTSTTLTADLICQNTTAVTVAADNVLLDLNGHTISCVNPNGYSGSCQNAQVPGPVVTFPGIDVAPGRHNITIRGNGSISGFPVGVRVNNGTNILIDGVTITGPPTLLSVDNVRRRGPTQGILIQNSKCVASPFAPVWSTTVQYSEITNQTQGITLEASSCVMVKANFIHDNGSINDIEISYGVMITDVISGVPAVPASNNVLILNTINRNGVNQALSAGILLVGVIAQVENNFIVENEANGNCGDGINLSGFASKNNITGNIVLNNSTSTYGAQCVAVAPGKYFDLNGSQQGPGNVWSATNVCKTQSPGIPAGVCP